MDAVEIRPGDEGTAVMPHSEVCMHLKVAGKPMRFRFLGPNRGVQLLEANGRLFSFPITAGEAGVHTRPNGTAYYYA